MHVLAINASCRPNGVTSQLVAAALSGAAEIGATAETIFLREKNIGYCANCLTCFKDMDSPVAPCSQADDVDGIIEAIRGSDAVLLASPVHSGFVSGHMVVLMERLPFRLCKPAGEILGLANCPVPRDTSKVRPSAIIMNAGIIPTALRPYCDQGTPWLREMAMMLFNGEVVADMYAGTEFSQGLSRAEANRAVLDRRLTPAQLDQARNLGRTLARAAQSGTVKPYSLDMLNVEGA